LGGASFDQAAAAETSEVRLADVSAGDRRAATEPFRGPIPACENFHSLRFPPLPGTAREVEEVVGIWNSFGDTSSQASRPPGVHRAAMSARGLLGTKASEESFKRLAPLSGVLHIATHGFSLTGDCATPGGSRRGVGNLVSATTPFRPSPKDDDPLLLSGLALAGANLRDATPPNQEDGILTAAEIAAMDLSGVHWAVLSACESGAGEVQPGEGILGLRRAFQVAGVGTLVMSLWEIEDEPTREWIREFYRSHLLRHTGAAESVRDACLEVLRNRRAGGRSTNPVFWGGFVAAGDWR